MKVIEKPEELLAAWTECFARKDLAGLSGLYATDALFFGSTPKLRRGRPEVLSYFEAGPVELEWKVELSDVVTQRLAPEVVSVAATATFTVAGNRTPARLTLVLIREGGSWRIASHHASPLPA